MFSELLLEYSLHISLHPGIMVVFIFQLSYVFCISNIILCDPAISKFFAIWARSTLLCIRHPESIRLFSFYHGFYLLLKSSLLEDIMALSLTLASDFFPQGHSRYWLQFWLFLQCRLTNADALLLLKSSSLDFHLMPEFEVKLVAVNLGLCAFIYRLPSHLNSGMVWNNCCYFDLQWHFKSWTIISEIKAS